VRRANLNFLVDALAFLAFVLLAATDLLLQFVLPSDSGRMIGEGIGEHAGARPVTVLWGPTRHEWGTVHLWIAVALMAALPTCSMACVTLTHASAPAPPLCASAHNGSGAVTGASRLTDWRDPPSVDPVNLLDSRGFGER
jgi:hypothetical protein